MIGAGISPAAPDHKEKRSTTFTALARRASGDVSLASDDSLAIAVLLPPVSVPAGLIAFGRFFLFIVTPHVSSR